VAVVAAALGSSRLPRAPAPDLSTPFLGTRSDVAPTMGGGSGRSPLPRSCRAAMTPVIGCHRAHIEAVIRGPATLPLPWERFGRVHRPPCVVGFALPRDKVPAVTQPLVHAWPGDPDRRRRAGHGRAGGAGLAPPCPTRRDRQVSACPPAATAGRRRHTGEQGASASPRARHSSCAGVRTPRSSPRSACALVGRCLDRSSGRVANG
jgi:hypothetical protein